MFNFDRQDTGSLPKWWRNIDKQILFLIIFLFLLGLLFSFSSTSSMVGEKLNKEAYFLFVKHFIFVFISLTLLFVISIQERKNIEKFLIPIFLITALFLVLVPFIGVEVKGSKRWIDIFFIPRFQQIEFVKPLFILLSAKIITDNNNNQLDMYNHWEGYGMMSFALKFTKISLGANLKLFLNQLNPLD